MHCGGELDETPVREFSTFTGDLEKPAEWLIACGITTAAVESAGVYRIPLLEHRGLEVKPVNTRHVKNVPGRKSDVLDCQWLQQLQPLRMAAFTLFNSKGALGAYPRRQRARLGALKAITATAHKLARLIHAMLTNGTAWVDAGQQYYEQRYRSRVMHNLKRKAQEPGFELVALRKAATL